MRTTLLMILSLTLFCTTFTTSFAQPKVTQESPSALTVHWSLFFHKGSRTDEFSHTLYTVPLQNVSTYLPDFCHVREKHQHDLLELRTLYTSQFENPDHYLTEAKNPYEFFNSLIPNRTYSYVLLKDELRITLRQEDTCLVIHGCRANKHLFLSNQKRRVPMAGEFTVYPHPSKEKLYVVINNNSGSYTPSVEKVFAFISLLHANMKDPRIKFIATDRGELFDLNKWFKRAKQPDSQTT